MNAPMQHSLPEVLEVEQALLGAILIQNDLYWRVADILKPRHFAEKLHGNLFTTISTMISEGRVVTPITLKPYVDADAKVGESTLFDYIVRLVSEAVTLLAVHDYARAIIETWSRRQLISLAKDLESVARNMPASATPEKIIVTFADRLTMIAKESDDRAIASRYGVLLPKAVERVVNAAKDCSAVIPWFLPEVSRIAGDIRRGNLIGFMSDSGGGKTSFSLQQARHVADKTFRSAFFSIEITSDEAALQTASQAAGIDLARLDAWTLNDRECKHLEREMESAFGLPFAIATFAECTLTDIRVRIEALKKAGGLDLVIIDHAKMISLPGANNDLFAERINALYRGLKALAKSLDVAIIILIQRNDDWKIRHRTGGSLAPMMGDAYGGGSVKQNLDVWFSLYRPEPLFKELMGQEQNAEKRDELARKYETSRGKAWLINHKRRRGEPGGRAEIRFEAEFTRFVSPPAQPALPGA